MKTLISLSFFVLSLTAHGADRWAAIGWSPAKERAYISRNAASEIEVREGAIRGCGEPDCVIMAVTLNQCVSWARANQADPFGRWWYGFSNGLSASNADSIALGICEKNAQGLCQTRETYCLTDEDSGSGLTVGEWIHNVGENTAAARGVLKLVHTVSTQYLCNQSGLPWASGQRIARRPYYVGLADLARRAQLSVSDLDTLLAYAQATGWVQP